MINKSLTSLLCLLFLTSGVTAQVWIQKVLSPTQINRYEGHHLVLVDFWATWCAPCIHASKQLTNTQEVFRRDLTIISLTREPEPVVQKFIEKHHPGLTIALDEYGRTFDFYGVNQMLPWSVLLNQRGELLWKGHPADLSHAMIERFILDNKGRKGKTIIHIAREPEASPVRVDKEAFTVRPSDSEEFFLMISEKEVTFNGRTSKLISELLRKPVQMVRVGDDPLISARIGILEWNKGSEHVLDKLLNAMNLEYSVVRENITCYRLTVKDKSLLWDDKQLNLGNFNGAYLTGDESLSVDNATVAEFAFRFSGVMDHPVYTDDTSPELHDWQVHYKYLDLTLQQLSNEYGIKLELKKGKHDVHQFIKWR
ncbi:MAG TPA: TlpA family protein disulfide reductase [Prolixibacteraceae bacterium]|jgi:thiol-disulfide isomerase/thioredoxin|nr:TlpA family protein disulfide reductase [Prolixibacteraceae bacterium]HOF55716.1 TlpA family protein disulfide reductase [Prolixibacteraceae bacterium]HOG97114.1 TlpA family protein disulfide reductase [Prolixibacteraceae bacterium]HOS00413.1 TlpA family protein disulfide reductase [Prolixibacteraceae bacterium]HOS90144.1 TlpA family protein disulfide reductase [Prolixibacteraceae bacterium]